MSDAARVFQTLDEWRGYRASTAFNESLGFVPTMGALHEGHASLVRRSASENDLTLASVFVNPTQFNDPKDLERYPRTPEKDVELLSQAGADFVIFPRYEEIYGDGYRYQVSEKELSRELCGRHRPGHFDGVLSVVLKLLMLAGPARAYFGEKDYQQLELIRGMAEAFFLPVEIVGCETMRASDGLALSSRNQLLTPAERELAPSLASELRSAPTAAHATAELQRLGFDVDYVEDRLGRRFAAARLGAVRLIDNVPLGKGRMPGGEYDDSRA